MINGARPLKTVIKYGEAEITHFHASEADVTTFFREDWPGIKKQIAYAIAGDLYGAKIDERTIDISVKWNYEKRPVVIPPPPVAA